MIDFVILQQDAFDNVDASTPMVRQKYMLSKVLEVTERQFQFKHFEEVGTFFKEIINEFKQMNYTEFESESFKKHEQSLEVSLLSRAN